MADLGRYGAYILPAFGVTALGFAWMIADSLLQARKWRRQTERLEADRLAKTSKP